MKTLIFIILKIAEIFIFVSLIFFISILAIFIIKPYDLSQQNIIIKISYIIILLLIGILGFNSAKKSFKKWISANKEWSEKIYNKLKR